MQHESDSFARSAAMSNLRDWLPPLEPPLGGYLRLSKALARKRRQRHWQGPHLRIAAGCASLVVIALLLNMRSPANLAMDQQQALVVSSLQQALATPKDDLVVTDGAAVVALRAPGVRLYWVAVTGENAIHSNNKPSPTR